MRSGAHAPCLDLVPPTSHDDGDGQVSPEAFIRWEQPLRAVNHPWGMKYLETIPVTGIAF